MALKPKKIIISSSQHELLKKIGKKRVLKNYGHYFIVHENEAPIQYEQISRTISAEILIRKNLLIEIESNNNELYYEVNAQLINL